MTPEKIQAMAGKGKMLMMLGVLLLALILLVNVFFLGPIKDNYWKNDKASRDAAPNGSELVENWRTIESVSNWTQPLTFLGMGAILFGIGISLLMILQTLRMQAMKMQEMFGNGKM